MTGIDKKGIFGKIRYMKHIWRMWRMVRKLHSLQKIYIETRRDDITDVDQRNITYFTKTGVFVPRDNLTLKNVTRGVINGTRENFREASRNDAGEIEDTIDSCIEVGFIAPYNQDQRLIALTGKGLKFIDPFYFLKYMITELGVIYTFFVSIIGSFVVGTGGFLLIWIFNKIIEIISAIS